VANPPNTQEAIFVKPLSYNDLRLIFMPFGSVPIFFIAHGQRGPFS